MHTFPLAYLLSFRTYGTWLRGDPRGSVDRHHRAFGTPMRPPDGELERTERAKLRHAPIELDAARRTIVQQTIRQVCDHNALGLHAVAVRTEHVHLVVSVPAGLPPERAMNSLQSWATRRLVEAGRLEVGTRAWARHGSTRYLWTQQSVEMACRYVLEGQGSPLPDGRGTDASHDPTAP